MLIYLDGRDSRKAKPNENFARELLELFTLGVNEYTQDDIIALLSAHLLGTAAFGYFGMMPHHGVPRFTHTFVIYEGGALPHHAGRL